MTVDVRCCDAFDLLRSLPDKSVNLIATDPPYFRVKDEPWDRAWNSADLFLNWLGDLADEWRRVLTDNGTVYCFASPQMAARVQMVLAERFTVLNEVVWVKPDSNATRRHVAQVINGPGARRFFPQTERIVVAEQVGADGSVLRASGYAAACQELHAGVFEPLRQYLIGEFSASGLTRAQVDGACGTSNVTQYWFSPRAFQIPTLDRWLVLGRLAPNYFRRGYDDLRRAYDDLRREYDDLRRPFNVTADVPHTDVWTYKNVPPGGDNRHPCAKPLDMMRHIIATSSRPGDTVLDCFVGGGATAVAAHELGRRFVGCDASQRWVDATLDRLGAPRQLTLEEGEAA